MLVQHALSMISENVLQSGKGVLVCFNAVTLGEDAVELIS